MTKSMTGFGRGSSQDSKRTIKVEIKSVNHRYLDTNIRLYRKYAFAEETVRSLVKERVSRGKLDIAVTIEAVEDASLEDTKVVVNRVLALEYKNALVEIAKALGSDEVPTSKDIASFPDVLECIQLEIDEKEFLDTIRKATARALEDFEKMRKAEGESLEKDILSRCKNIDEIVGKISKRAIVVPELYRERLTSRLSEILSENNMEVPMDRILTEAALFADKANIDEEITRLGSHTKQMESILLDRKDAKGKKMDFLVQEMNREANTIGSKANDLEITSYVLELKSEVEKIREQVQNIQ